MNHQFTLPRRPLKVGVKVEQWRLSVTLPSRLSYLLFETGYYCMFANCNGKLKIEDLLSGGGECARGAEVGAETGLVYFKFLLFDVSV